MGLALFLLFRSMTKHLRKVRLAADDAAAPPAKAGRTSTGAAATDEAANKEAGSQGS
jgi:hypothetical protein